MATRAEHLAEALANRAHAERLLRDLPEDPIAMKWAMTAAFYCAVHCIEAHLRSRGAPVSGTHMGRAQRMRDPRFGVPTDVYRAYMKLKFRSEGARYRLQRFTAARVQSSIRHHLDVVTRFAGL